MSSKQIEVLTCLFVLFVCVITQNEQVAALANDDDDLESGDAEVAVVANHDDALQSGEGIGDPEQACIFSCDHNFLCKHNDNCAFL